MKRVPTTMGKRLAHIRAKCGLSGRELDRLAGLHQGHTWFIEKRPDRSVESDTLVSVARVFGVSLDWLILGLGSLPDDDALMACVQRAREGVVDRADAAPRKRRTARPGVQRATADTKSRAAS